MTIKRWVKGLRHSFILLSFLVGVNFCAVAAEVKIKDMSKSFYEYNTDVASYVPVLSYTSKFSLLVQKVNYEENKRYYLRFSPKEELYLFVNGQITGCFSADSVYSLPMSSFEPFVKAGQVVFTFSFGDKKVKPFPVSIVSINDQLSVFKNISYDLTARGRDFNNDILLLAVLLILIVVAIMKGQDKGKLESYFSPVGLIRGKKIEDYIVNGVGDLQNLPFVYLVSLFWAVFMVYNNYSVIDLGLESKDINNFDLVSKYLLWNSLSIVLFFWVKYLFLNGLAKLVSLKGIVNQYFFEIIRYYAISAFILMVLSILYKNLGLGDSVIVYTSFVLLLFWMLRLSSIFFKTVGFHKVFIISYLCTSEILPLFILVKGITSF